MSQLTETEWDETAEEAEEADNLSQIKALLDGEQLDLDAEYSKRRCGNCFYAVIKTVENNYDNDVHELKCFYSPGQIAEIAPDFFCGFWMHCGPKTLKKREGFEITVPEWAKFYDKREEF